MARVQPVPGQPPPTADDLDRLCQRVGSLFIGMPEEEARRFLPGPGSAIPNAGATFHFRLGPAGPDAVATFEGGLLLALQLSGVAADPALTFQGVYLGMPETELEQRLGPALQRSTTQAGSDLWAYRPWPFSFLLRDGRVTSIRFYSGRSG